jgi:RNA polymerase sigma-70 factor (ECF subfamily)
LVDALPPAQRQALTLYYYEERAVAEVAAMLGLPEATVKTHLHRGRQTLRGRLAACGLADPALWL